MKSNYQEVLEQLQERKKDLSKLSAKLFLDKTITLEIGCGHGHFLISFAQAHPSKICVGVDLCTKRILQGKRKQNRSQLDNLYFIKADIIEFLESLPENVIIDEIFILFPDPWPKTRHHKNRIIQGSFLELLSFKSSVGTKLHFRTDHQGYFDWTIKEIKKSFCWELSNNSIWNFEEETIFQKKMQTYQSLIALKI